MKLQKLALGSALGLASIGAFAADITLPSEVTSQITAAGVMLVAALTAMVVMQLGPWALRRLQAQFGSR